MNTILRGANFGKTIVSLVSESTKRKLSTSAQRNEKVAVCGASGGMKIGLQVKPPGFGHDRKATFGQSKRLYTTEASRKENIQPWWKFPFINRRGYTSRSYDELKNIDFLEESNLDDHVVPKIIYDELFAKYEKVIEEKKSAEEKLDNKDRLLKKVGVIYYFRVRIDRLQWLLTEDPDVQAEMKKSKVTVNVPMEVPPDGQQSYTTRYRVWRAIARAMVNKEKGVVSKFKIVLQEVGFDITDEDSIAASGAMLFNLMSSEAKKDETDIDWDDEEDVIKALMAWKVRNEDALKMARAIYKFDVF